MIVGTAGHIDHGKTTLVRALTGIDTDRLPQERERGISIELGYAFLPVPGSAQRIGFIDVPGHERLVHTMISGATGIDFGLLLVAADDGVMPQTREHLAVLSLLGLRRGAVVLTKTDRAEPGRMAALREAVRLLVAGSAFDGAPVFAVSAQTGEGIEALRDALFEAALAGSPVAAGESAFRLAIDRCFSLAGVGTVVTGTVHAGRVAVGDELTLAPSPGDLRLRVRSVHAQGRAVEEARVGERCAVGLVGVAKDQVERGQWGVAPEVALQTDRLDARIVLWPGEAKALRSGTPVQVHIGAAAAMGTVAVLQVEGGASQVVEPGEAAFVQLVMRVPIGAWHGDRVIVRDASASRTLAGGTVLDPFAPVRYRRTPQRLAELAAWTEPDETSRWRLLVEVAPHGLSLARAARAHGIRREDIPALPRATLTAHDKDEGDWALAADHATRLAVATTEALREHHAREPEMPGLESARLRRLVAPRLPGALWHAVLAASQRAGRLAVHGPFVRLPEHALRLSATDTRIQQKLAPIWGPEDFEGRWARDLARDARESEALVRATLARLAQSGELHQVVKDLYYPTAVLARLAAIVREQAGTQAELTAARFRDATGLGRKRAIQILEYFDKIGLLRRVGDTHRLRSDTRLFEGLER